MESVLLQLLSVIIGIGCSLLGWWIVYRKVVPKIEFAEKIIRMPANGERIPRYAIRMLNIGNRKIIDLEIKVQVNIMGLFEDLPTVEHQFFMATTFDRFPVLDSKKGKDPKNSLMFRFLPHKTNEFKRKIYPKFIRDLINSEKLTLDDVFKIKEDVSLQVIIAGFDEFSGARKLFLSKRYTQKEMINGYYKDNTLQIIETGN